MKVTTINSELLAKMFLAGAKNLDSKKEWINELNFVKENLFSNKLKFSGMEDLLLEQYKNHRQSFM